MRRGLRTFAAFWCGFIAILLCCLYGWAWAANPALAIGLTVSAVISVVIMFTFWCVLVLLHGE